MHSHGVNFVCSLGKEKRISCGMFFFKVQLLFDPNCKKITVIETYIKPDKCPWFQLNFSPQSLQMKSRYD